VTESTRFLLHEIDYRIVLTSKCEGIQLMLPAKRQGGSQFSLNFAGAGDVDPVALLQKGSDCRALQPLAPRIGLDA
jgi:hypothetical protein